VIPAYFHGRRIVIRGDYRKPLTIHAERNEIPSIQFILSDFLTEIAEALKEINADYTRHSLAAREIARQFFDAEKVLRSLLERAGI
jgi:hypothetical protein